jgi:hypothetical protein
MVYVMEWEFPVDKLQEAVFAYKGLRENLADEIEVDLYWTADTSGGKYRGVAIVRVDSAEALYEFFGLIERIAQVRFAPAVAGDAVVQIWEKQLISG